MDIPFYTILDDYMSECNISAAEIERKSQGRFLARTIRRWRNGDYIPEFESASELCNILRLDISLDDLRESLRISKDYHEINSFERITNNRKTMIFRLNVEKMDLPYSVEEIREIIERRAKDKYGDKTWSSDYIRDLILKDLKEENLI